MKKLRIKKLLLWVVGMLLLAYLVSAAAIVWDGLRDELGVADVAVVLGNEVKADGTPSPRLKARLDKTLELYRQGLFADVIVSGGTGASGYDEAEVMKKYLVEAGVPEERVLVDSHGANTYLTAQNAARLMRERHWQSALVVSQHFHISRSKLALRRFGVSLVYSAHAEYFETRDLYSTARETIGYYSYLFRGYDE